MILNNAVHNKQQAAVKHLFLIIRYTHRQERMKDRHKCMVRVFNEKKDNKLLKKKKNRRKGIPIEQRKFVEKNVMLIIHTYIHAYMHTYN